MMVTGVQICGASVVCLTAATVMGWRWSPVSGRRTDVGNGRNGGRFVMN